MKHQKKISIRVQCEFIAELIQAIEQSVYRVFNYCSIFVGRHSRVSIYIFREKKTYSTLTEFDRVVCKWIFFTW